MPPSTIGIVVGFKPAPDYGTTFFGALLDQEDADLRYVAATSTSSPAVPFPPDRVEVAWRPYWTQALDIARWSRRRKPDLIHLQHEINLFGGGRGVLLLPVLLCLLRLQRRRVVATIHVVVPLCSVRGGFSGLFSFPRSGIVSWLMKLGLRASYVIAGRLCHRVIVHTESLARRLVDDYGVPPSKLRVIPHPELPIPIDRRVAGDHLPAALRGQPVVLYFGFLLRRKGIEDLIDAWAEVTGGHPHHRLVIAGQAPQADYERELKERTRSRGLEGSVVFTGYVSPPETAALLAAAEFVVLPAIHCFHASGPQAAALAAGKPVVAPRIGTFTETIVDGQDGLLYNRETPGALATALRTMMDDAGARERMSRRVAAKREAYQPAAVAEATVKLYREMVNMSPGLPSQ